MTINKTSNGSELTIALGGRLDTTTAPELGKEIEQLAGVESLIFNFTDLEYISSAGLRVLLSAQKIMNTQGKMVIRGANENIQDIFEVTGFVDILTIE